MGVINTFTDMWFLIMENIRGMRLPGMEVIKCVQEWKLLYTFWLTLLQPNYENKIRKYGPDINL